jgi:hypothetical protein
MGDIDKRNFERAFKKVRDTGYSQPELVVTVSTYHALRKILKIIPEFNPQSSAEIWLKYAEIFEKMGE